MSRRTIGLVVLIVGVAIIAVSALADVIGIGGGGDFGFRQITGVGGGVLVVIFGALVAFRDSEPG